MVLVTKTLFSRFVKLAPEGVVAKDLMKPTRELCIGFGGKPMNMKVTALEAGIASQCQADAFWKYSFPLMTLTPVGIQLATSQGHLAPSAPLVIFGIFGIAAGYQLGQLLWQRNNDCILR